VSAEASVCRSSDRRPSWKPRGWRYCSGLAPAAAFGFAEQSQHPPGRPLVLRCCQVCRPLRPPGAQQQNEVSPQDIVFNVCPRPDSWGLVVQAHVVGSSTEGAANSRTPAPQEEVHPSAAVHRRQTHEARFRGVASLRRRSDTHKVEQHPAARTLTTPR